jgi:archaellum component FlaG (FlaF/FlaG flagellin family)
MSSFQLPEPRRSKQQNSASSGFQSLVSKKPESSRSKLDRFIPSFDSALIVNVTVLVSGAIAGVLEFVTHLAVSRMNTAPAYHAFIDASVVSLMTIALVGVCIASARAKRQAMQEQIQTAADLNHHLRNALQVIANSSHLPEEKRAEALLASVDRIDEAIGRLIKD